MKKKTDKPRSVTINVNIFSNITVDGKSILCIIIAIISLTLIVSICDPNARAEIIRYIIGIANNC